jgi:hypothetical protein
MYNLTVDFDDATDKLTIYREGRPPSYLIDLGEGIKLYLHAETAAFNGVILDRFCFKLWEKEALLHKLGGSNGTLNPYARVLTFDQSNNSVRYDLDSDTLTITMNTPKQPIPQPHDETITLLIDSDSKMYIGLTIAGFGDLIPEESSLWSCLYDEIADTYLMVGGGTNVKALFNRN